MREKQKRKKNNFKNLVLENIYENFKIYVVVIIIFIIGIVAGVIFVNNTTQEQGMEIQSYINKFIEQLKSNYQINKSDLLKETLWNNIFLIISMWFIGSTVIGIPIVFGIVLFRGFCLGYTVSSIMRSAWGAKRIDIYI